MPRWSPHGGKTLPTLERLFLRWLRLLVEMDDRRPDSSSGDRKERAQTPCSNAPKRNPPMKHNDPRGQRPTSIANLRSLVRTNSPGPTFSVMSPEEALGSLVNLEPFERKFFGQLIAENWATGPASLTISQDDAHELRSILAVREFNA